MIRRPAGSDPSSTGACSPQIVVARGRGRRPARASGGRAAGSTSTSTTGARGSRSSWRSATGAVLPGGRARAVQARVADALSRSATGLEVDAVDVVDRGARPVSAERRPPPGAADGAVPALPVGSDRAAARRRSTRATLDDFALDARRGASPSAPPSSTRGSPPPPTPGPPTGSVRSSATSCGSRVYELEEGAVPAEVAINEAVVLAKRYATEDAARLVNGILGRIEREEAADVSARREPRPRAEELLERLERSATSSSGSPRPATPTRRRRPRRDRRAREGDRGGARSGARASGGCGRLTSCASSSRSTSPSSR